MAKRMQTGLPQTFLITDGQGDVGRIVRLVQAALAGGIRGIQLREPTLAVADLQALCVDLFPQVDRLGGMLVINHEVGVAAAGHAHAVQLGHRSPGVAEVAPVLPPGVQIGASVHNAEEIERAIGADFLVLAPLFATRCKPDAEPLGVGRAAEWIESAPCPVLLLGGIDEGNVAAARGIGASGVAVMSSVCDALDPVAAAASLVASENAG